MNPRARRLIVRVSSSPFILAVRAYQVTLRPLMGGQCRFVPTCSDYAVEAYRTHGPIRGSLLTARRLLRCHPLGGWGFDPVPLPRDLERGAPGASPRPEAREARSR